MNHEQEAQTLRQKSILTQYQLEKDALVKHYSGKIAKLPVKWEQHEDEVFRIQSEEEIFLLEEMHYFLEIRKKQLGIETVYEGFKPGQP